MSPAVAGFYNVIIKVLMKRFFHKHRSHLIILGTILLSCAGSAGFLWHANTQALTEEQAAHHKSAQMTAQVKIIKQEIAAKKLAAKQKAEADAKAKAAAAEKAAQTAANNSASVSTADCHSTGPHMDPSRIDAIVNKKHCITPIDFTPSDLVTVDGATISAKAEPSFVAMYNAAAAAGAGFGVTSSFRSYSDQVATYNQWVAVNGSASAADTVSARPGYSEHQTGLAADLSCNGAVLEAFAGSVCYQWLVANAADYGFIERYPVGLTSITGYSPEAWHWRYVGAAVAKDMKAKGLQTLEQYWGVTGGDY